MKKILVTGGNRGIGKEICRQLAEQGHQVYLGSRDVEKGNKAAGEMTGRVEVVQLEMGNEASMVKAVEFIRSQTDHLDGVINNAAVMPSSDGVAKVDMQTLQNAFQINFFGVLRLNQLCIPLLHGSASPRIVHISSGMGAHEDLKYQGYAAYRLTKAALNDLTILMAAEHPSIRINAVCPGWVKTDMGGSGASREVSQGADTPVWLVTAADVPTGKFLRDRQVIPW